MPFKYRCPTLTCKFASGWTLAYVSTSVKPFEKAGTWALLARALAGTAIAKASLDLAGYDFTQVQQPNDEMMLPGGLKYGGLLGFAPAFNNATGTTELYRPPTPGVPWLSSALLGPHTTLRPAGAKPDSAQMVRWLMQRE